MTGEQHGDPSFGPLFNEKTYGGQENIIRTMHRLGCFNKPNVCKLCGSSVRLEISTSKKAGRRDAGYTYGRIRCCKTRCRTTISLFENTIWTEIGDRALFVFCVGAFIMRQTTVAVAMLTGSREDTISKYFRVIKNAIHVDVEQSLVSFRLGGDGERVQIDESHVFSRKYVVGRSLVMTTHGWVFGIIEDKPNGRLFLIWFERETRRPSCQSLKSGLLVERRSSPTVGVHTQTSRVSATVTTRSITRNILSRSKMKFKLHKKWRSTSETNFG